MKALESELKWAEKRAARLSPNRSGPLRAGWHTEFRRTATGAEATLSNRAPHAPFVFLGTKPHIIRPKRARVLAFRVADRQVFARQVRHPGTKPNDIPARVMKELRPRLKRAIHQEAQTLARDVAKAFST